MRETLWIVSLFYVTRRLSSEVFGVDAISPATSVAGCLGFEGRVFGGENGKTFPGLKMRGFHAARLV
jgi:hypothetical protein